MLDELLGRAELKARIEELEEEKQHLRRRAEAEEERQQDDSRGTDPERGERAFRERLTHPVHPRLSRRRGVPRRPAA